MGLARGLRDALKLGLQLVQKRTICAICVFLYALTWHLHGVLLRGAENLEKSDAPDLHAYTVPPTAAAPPSSGDPSSGSALPRKHRFSLENLVPRPGTEDGGGSCGIFKCFYPLASDRSVGYLVSQSGNTEDMDPVQVERNAMQVQWERGQYLSEHYGLRHLMLAAPERLHFETAALAEYMSNHNSKKMGWKTHVHFNASLPLDVQRVRVLPQPYALIGCMKVKRRHAEKTWGSFMASVNRDTFLPTFTQAINHLETILDTEIKRGALGGARDFQGIVSNEGDIYLIDISLHPPEKEEAKLRLHQQYEKDDQSLKDCHLAFNKLLNLTKTHVEAGGLTSGRKKSNDKGKKPKRVREPFDSPEDETVLDGANAGSSFKHQHERQRSVETLGKQHQRKHREHRQRRRNRDRQVARFK